MSLKITKLKKADDKFYNRVDAYIFLSNDQLDEYKDRSDVAASMTFSTARFNVWSAALNFQS